MVVRATILLRVAMLYGINMPNVSTANGKNTLPSCPTATSFVEPNKQQGTNWERKTYMIISFTIIKARIYVQHVLNWKYLCFYLSFLLLFFLSLVRCCTFRITMAFTTPLEVDIEPRPVSFPLQCFCYHSPWTSFFASQRAIFFQLIL